MSPRVGIIALVHESNTFLPLPTTLELFERDVLVTGSAIREIFGQAWHEVGGMLRRLDALGLEAVPIFAARTTPYGTLTRDCADGLMSRLAQALEQAGPLDGLLVAPHGATVSEPEPDFDGYWLSWLREQLGPQIPIIGTLDAHTNLSPRMVAATDAQFAYRTNPHLDQAARGEEAASLMARTLRGEVRPVQAAVFPPMAINIERQCTEESPLQEYIAQLDAARRQPGILGVSLLLGFPYADVEEMGSSLLVVADGDEQLARQYAADLAAKLWEIRQPLAGTFLSIADAVTQAAQLPGPVCLLDMGDNVGGGSPADGTLLAHELHQRKIGPALVILNDPALVEQATASGVGACFEAPVGGKTDDRHGPPLVATWRVEQLCDGLFTEDQPRHGGASSFNQGPTAILSTESGLTVMVTSRRTPPFSLKQLTTFGIDPAAYQVLVAKGVNAPIAAYQPVCRSILRVNTPGVTTADMTQLEFHHRRRPMFPFERETVWNG